jgi:hypothetical protein
VPGDHSNSTLELIVTHVEVLQGGHYMEKPSPSERIATVGGDNERTPVRDGVAMDEQREH